MEFVDTTALSTALPTLARAFHEDPVRLKIALTSYILALAVGAPASGWVAERYGPRRVFAAAVCLFLAASVACGFASSTVALVAARSVQGLGGALMTPVARLILVRSTPKRDLVAAMAWFTTPALIGPLVGPPLAGLIVGTLGWRWIFFVNVPIGFIALAAAARFVPRLPAAAPTPFDREGVLLWGGVLAGLIGAPELCGVARADGRLVGIALAVAAASCLRLWLRRPPAAPLLDLTLLRLPAFRSGLLGGFIVRLGLGASPFLLPLLLQLGLGLSPMAAGLVSLGGGAGALAARPLAPRLLHHLGFRWTLITTAGFTGAMAAAPLGFGPRTPFAVMFLALFAGGAARALQFTASNTVAYADVTPARTAAATTLATVGQQVGLALGVSFGGLLLSLARVSALDRHDLFAGPFAAVGVVTLLSLLVYLPLSAYVGSELAGRDPEGPAHL
jgi:EmrB/QacA subfamily drug resistance transporter